MLSVALAVVVAIVAVVIFVLESYFGMGDDYNIIVWNFVLSLIIVVAIVNVILIKRRKKKKKKKKNKKTLEVYNSPRDSYNSEYY